MSNTMVTDEQQVVVFLLASDTYAVDIGSVREIIRMQDITRVPRTPDFVEGVINLRGKVIPVIDPRKRFALEVSDCTPESRIVVVDVEGQHVGMVVDAVTEVLRIRQSLIEPPSTVITTADSDCIKGIAMTDERLIILLSLETLLSEKEKKLLVSGTAPEPVMA